MNQKQKASLEHIMRDDYDDLWHVTYTYTFQSHLHVVLRYGPGVCAGCQTIKLDEDGNRYWLGKYFSVSSRVNGIMYQRVQK